MKSPSLVILSAVAGCAIGYLGVGLLGNRSTESAAVRSDNSRAGNREPTPPSAPSAGLREGRAGAKIKSFASFLRDAPLITERNRACRDVERVDTAELKAAILESISKFGSLSTLESEAASSVYVAATRELYRRDGEKTLEWAESEAPAAQRSEILSGLLMEAAKESPDLMKSWAERFRGEFGDHWADRFTFSAVVAAAGRGTAELLRVRELLSSNLLPTDPSIYPEDFDFNRLVTSSLPVWDMERPIVYWAATDKEASWDGVKHVVEGTPGKGTNLVGAVFRGVLAMEGEEKAAGWIVEKIGELHPQLRQRAMQHMVLEPVGTEATVALVKAFPDDEDKVFFVSNQFQTFRPGSGLAALEALGSPQLQAEALTASAVAAGRLGPAHEKTQEFFKTTMDQLQLDPQAREKIMATLNRAPAR